MSPAISASPVSVTVVEGNNALFECQANARPRPVIQWYYYDPVSNTTSPLMSGSKYNIAEMTEGERGLLSTLTILSVGVSDFGEYRCTAENVVGRVSATAMLIINGIGHDYIINYIIFAYILL